VLNCPAESFSRANKVITMDMIGKVRRMHFRDRISLSDIARRTARALHAQLKAAGYAGG
jgi:hypothetical protein